MEHNLQIAAEHNDDLVTLVLHGELDIATVSDVRAAVAEHAEGQTAIVVDLHDLDFIDSSGLGLLLALNGDEAGRVHFRDPSETVARLLDLTGIGGLLRWRS